MAYALRSTSSCFGGWGSGTLNPEPQTLNPKPPKPPEPPKHPQPSTVQIGWLVAWSCLTDIFRRT